jgi:hypothetical protein
MAEHSLAIHRFQTRLALTGLREDGPPLGREVGRAVRELLPAAAARALEPLLGSRDGVLRIDRIALTLRLGRVEISALRLADLLAREIARAVAERALGASTVPRIGAGLAHWPDHDSFAAAYVAHRLGLAPAPDWAFPDFRPLAHLAPHEAALELMAARPAILAALARLVGVAAAPALASSLPERGAALLIEQLVTGRPAELPAGAVVELAAMIASLSSRIESGPANAAIAAAAAALSARGAPEAEGVRQVVMLARLAVALAALRDATLAIWGRAPGATDLAPEALVHLPQPARRLAQAALAPLTQAEPVRAVLARLLDRAHRRADAADRAATRAAEAAAAPRVIASRIAGIGLLMPAVLAHGLPERLSPAALSRTLAAALGPEAEAATRLDPLLAGLAPFDPRDPDHSFPPVPEALRAMVPETRRDGAAEGEGAAGWAACLIHSFAAGLGGFEASSLHYLRRQFLARPGTLHIAQDRLTLVLDPLPLGVLLRLSGFHGWTGRLPQAQDALLRIEVRES